jgi:hypothetical protein
MIITFLELNIKTSDYNGARTYRAFTEIVNAACDYVMANHFPGQDEMECIFNPEYADVDFIRGTIHLDTATPRMH